MSIADKGNISFLRRPLQRLFPLEIVDDVVEESESQPEEHTSVRRERNLESVQAQPDKMPTRPRRRRSSR